MAENTEEPFDAASTIRSVLEKAPYTCVTETDMYTAEVTVTREQLERALLLFQPKPKRSQADPTKILHDHKLGVLYVGMYILERMLFRYNHHDDDKPFEGEKHPFVNGHHWTFEPEAEDEDDHGFGITILDMGESWADYVATVYGRLLAGREFDVLKPTSTLLASDVLMASVLMSIQELGIATVVIKPKNPETGDNDA